VVDQEKFFRALGERIRKLRKAKEYSQEDMISLGFSARHWQQIEAGRPITVTTLLRICEVFGVGMAKMVRGLDRGIYRAE
jgi:transcriptional regulator with XRE-family HTH domain